MERVPNRLLNYGLSYLCGEYDELCINQTIAGEAPKVPGKPGDDITAHDDAQIAQLQDVAVVGSFVGRKSKGLINILDEVILDLFHHLDLISCEVAGTFFADTTDRYFRIQIRRIWKTLINKGFYGECYVAYGREFRDIEQQALKKAKPAIDGGLPRHFPKSDIRIYVRQGDGLYKSCLTGVGDLKLDPEKLVYFSFNGGHTFVGVVRAVIDYIGGFRAFNASLLASLKRNICLVSSEDKGRSEMDSLFDLTSVLKKNTGDATQENLYEEHEFFPINEVITILNNTRAGFDERLSFFGIYGNGLGEKKERVTVGENLMNAKRVDNINLLMLHNLKVSIDDLKSIAEEVPEDLTVKTNEMELMAGVYKFPQGQGTQNPQQPQQQNGS